MSSDSPQHRLLARQLRVSTIDGDVDISKFTELVNGAYQDFDAISQRTQRSLITMSEELSEANKSLRADSLRLREFYDYAAACGDIGLVEINLLDRSVHCTESMKEIIGYCDTDNGQLLDYLQSVLEKSAIDYLENEVVTARKNSLIRLRTPIIHSKKGKIWILIQGRVVERVPENHMPSRLAGTIVDVTEQVVHEQALEKLSQLSADVNLSIDEKCQQTINLLRQVVGVDFIRINRLIDEHFKVEYAAGERTGMPVGSMNQVKHSLCSEVLAAPNGVKSICDMAAEGFSASPAFQKLGVRSYLGAKIIVHGELYGTVCMTSAYPIQFSDQNINLIRIAAQWLGGQIELEWSRLSLQEAHTNAVEASQAKSDFLATMSHEIRTPLNGIMSLVELMQESPANAEQKQRLDTVMSSCTTLLSVISDILDFSKIEAGKIELDEQLFDLKNTARDVIDIFQSTAQEKNLQLNLEMKGELPGQLWGDDNRLKQVLTNLLSNALKFTHEGSVLLGVHGQIDKDICRIRFEVVDTGIGMSEDYIQQVFDKFTQADSSTTREYGGTGLGLAICKQLVALMNGSITIDSHLEQGSTVTVDVPFKVGQAAFTTEALAQRSESVEGFSGKVLVAEDNAVNQFVIRSLLSSMGLEVTIAENGVEALSKLSKSSFDLVLMDMQMPVLDGLETTKRIRKLDEHEGIPVIALTANAMSVDKQRCIDAGMNDFVSKPVTKKQISQVLQKFMASSRC